MRLRHFLAVYRLYRKSHTARYSAGVAYRIAFLGSPF